MQRRLILLLNLLGACFAAGTTAADDTHGGQPNILVIVADDLGYADVGAWGSEIRTPSIDALAGEGVQLLSFHTAPTCGPTRAMLMSGIDHHRAGVGTNAASLLRLPNLRGRPGYEGYLNDRVVTFATLLKDAGYHTFMVGKWDLGKTPDTLPVARGFDRSFGLADGGASHFSDATRSLSAAPGVTYFADDAILDALPSDFYSTSDYTDRMIEFVSGRPEDGRPWLAYIGYTAVHWPLQVPDEWLERYAGRYADGWEALRHERLARQKELGIVGEDTELPVPMSGVDAWQDLPPARRRFEERRMELYAAMTELLDREIGRLVDTLANSGGRETVVIFLSDNGAEGNDIGAIGDNEYWIPLNFDNRHANLGRRDSFVWLGAGWAQAAVTPLKIFKSFPSEGGIRTPALVYSSTGRFAPGKRRDVVTVMDIAPTILELAGVEHPGETWKGRDVLPLTGRSVLSYLEDSAPAPHAGRAIGWELYGNRALILDDWKILRTFPPEGDGAWQLFNLRTDPAESNDLAAAEPSRLAAMIELWQGYAEANGVAIIDEDIGYGRY